MHKESPEKFDSITHFLQTGGFNYRVFDMGRKVNRIPNDVFENIEGQENAYPSPFQKKAWLALLFWEEEKQNEKPIEQTLEEKENTAIAELESVENTKEEKELKDTSKNIVDINIAEEEQNALNDADEALLKAMQEVDKN